MKSCSLYPKPLNCLNDSAILNSPVLCIAAANFCCILYTILRILESTRNMACQKKHLTPSSSEFCEQTFTFGIGAVQQEKKTHNGCGIFSRFTASLQVLNAMDVDLAILESLKKYILSSNMFLTVSQKT